MAEWSARRTRKIEFLLARQNIRNQELVFFSFSNSVADVAKGVVELVEDDTKVGEVLVVCITDGTKYKQFTN